MKRIYNALNFTGYITFGLGAYILASILIIPVWAVRMAIRWTIKWEKDLGIE